MRKRLTATVMGLVMTMSVLSGCGGGNKGETASGNGKFNKEGYPIVDEKITLSVMGATNGSMPDDWNDLVLFKELEKLTNIHLDFK